MLKKLGFAFGCVALLATLPAAADEWNKKTTVTFSAPVELPGIVLTPGTYVFKLADSNNDRHIVMVYNADETHLYTTILAIPNYQLKPTDKTVLTFKERPGSSPEAIRAWFYPGDNFGQEFVYPKTRGAEIAASAQVPVLTGEVKPAEKSEDLIREPVIAAVPEKPAETTTAEVGPVTPPPSPVTAEPAAPAPAPAPVPELPKTASPLPLLILAGFGSLGLAAALRAFCKHTA